MPLELKEYAGTDSLCYVLTSMEWHKSHWLPTTLPEARLVCITPNVKDWTFHHSSSWYTSKSTPYSRFHINKQDQYIFNYIVLAN